MSSLPEIASTCVCLSVGFLLTSSVDMCVTDGPGLRWPFVGPFMGGVLGGGGTKEGFRHMVTHIGPTAQVWYDDIDAKSVTLNGDVDKINKLDASCQEMLEGVDLGEVKQQFGKSLSHLLQLKGESQAASSGNGSK